MIRELVLVSADLRAAPWFASGAPPLPAIPADIELRVIADNDTEPFARGPVSRETAHARLAAGDRCAIAVDGKTHAMIAQLWLSPLPRGLDWIGCTVAPPPGHMLIYNAWVDPPSRGHGLHWALASLACQTVVSAGLTKICAGVERQEFAPFAKKYADMGLALIAPYASLWTWRVLGRTLRMHLPPPRALARISLQRRAEFPSPAGTPSCA
jgi:hypothetical protein